MNNHFPDNELLPDAVWASRYSYAALLDAEGNEQPITESMIRSACEEARDALFAFLPQRVLLQQGQTGSA